MRHWLGLGLVFGLSACATSPSDPQAEAKGRELLAQMKAAMGGAALDAPSGFHETGFAERDDGGRMTYETWGDLRSLRSASLQTIDGYQLRAGFDGSAAWHVDPSGAVSRDTDAHTLYVVNMGTYLTVGGYFHPDRFPAKVKYLGREHAPNGDASDDDAPAKASSKPSAPAPMKSPAKSAAKDNDETWDVVEVWPEGTVPINLWLNPQTHRLERISGSISGEESFTSIIDKRREVEGASVGFELRQIEAGHTVKQTVKTYTFEAVPPERFSPPKAP